MPNLDDRMFKYLIPHIALADLRPMLAVASIGALFAGVYGIFHDFFTYSISTEYFTRLKFKQFSFADWGWGDLGFVATIGFLATWWVGFAIAWLLARRLLPKQPRSRAYRQISLGFAIVFCSAISCGILAYLYGLWRGPDADYSAWEWAIIEYSVERPWPFIRVAYIHNAGYLGGVVGFIIALLTIRPQRGVSHS